jgi:hypothetical protein
VRFKLVNGKWHSQSTNATDKDEAITNAEYLCPSALIKVLELVKQAVEAGELDAQINNASVNVRKVFDK